MAQQVVLPPVAEQLGKLRKARRDWLEAVRQRNAKNTTAAMDRCDSLLEQYLAMLTPKE